jgi:hypothetical protein
VHFSGDTYMACLASVSELASCLMCNLLLTCTVACLVSVSELAWVLMCNVLLTCTVACLISVSESALVLMCTLLVMQMWHVLFQFVSWPVF